MPPPDNGEDDATRAVAAPPELLPQPAAPQVTPGSLLDRYPVIEEIGRGGMGVVLRAYDPKLQREVALKVVRTASADAEARLVREAQAMARLSHPNVVAVYDVAVQEDDTQSQVVMAMEYVPGTDLRHWLVHEERAPEAIVEAFVAAGRGLAAAHAEGLLHRDFKAANVLVGDDGRVRVTDFGLARLDTAPSHDSSLPELASGSGSGPSAGPLTVAGTVMGTPRYMAPEQHRAEELSPAIDQYAFCVSLWEALTKEPPFIGSGPELLSGKLRGPPPWPRRVALRTKAADAIARGLSPRAEDRHPSMHALLEVLIPQPRSQARFVVPGVLIAGALSVAAWNSIQSDGQTQCTGAAQLLADVWGPDRRAALATAYADANVSYAPSTPCMWLEGPTLHWVSTIMGHRVLECARVIIVFTNSILQRPV